LSFYLRRSNKVNIIGGTGIEEESNNNRKFCPRCNFSLDYLEEDKIFVCCKCGWGLQDKHLVAADSNKKKRKRKGVVTTSNDAAAKEEDIFVVSKKEQRGKKKDPFEYLKKDDAYLAKLGYNLVSESIDIPSGDKEVLSKEDLDREKGVRLRGKRIS
jgi:hypothetical protein